MNRNVILSEPLAPLDQAVLDTVYTIIMAGIQANVFGFARQYFT